MTLYASMKPERPLVAAVVLNWNRRDDTLACLESLCGTAYPSMQLIVVDNASTDDSVPAVRSAFPQSVVLCSDQNLGYAGGNNLGIAHALKGQASYVLVINNDTRVDKHFLEELIQAGEVHPEAGALVPKIYYWDQPTLIWSAGARWCRFPPRVKLIGFNAPDAPRYNQPRELEYATGCAWLLRRSALQDTGGFDPNYFMYQEDLDFCYRLCAKGYTLQYVPTAHVWHRVSAGLKSRSARWWYHWGRSMVRFYRVDDRFPASWLVLFAGWVLLRELAKGDILFVKPFLRGLSDGRRAL